MFITLSEAIKIAETKRGRLMNSTATVSQVIDCGEKWLMEFAEDIGCCGTLPLFVSKETGECELCVHNEEQVDLILQGVEVTISREAHNNKSCFIGSL